MSDSQWFMFAREIGLETLESAIAPGALATSETLNRFRRSIEDMVQDVSERSREYEMEVSRASSWITSMSLWMYQYVTTAYDMLRVAQSNWKFRLVDMFGSGGWTIGGDMRDYLHGQLTPPVSQNTVTTNHRKRVYLSFSDSISAYHLEGGDVELDMTQMLHDQEWTVPLVLPDAGRRYIWLYLPLVQTSLLTNNAIVAVLPPGSVYIRRVSVLSGNTWHSVYSGSNSFIFSGRFWWDVRTTGNVRAVGIQLERLSLSTPSALVHLSANSTRFEEAGTATVDTQEMFRTNFTIRSYTINAIFPSNPSFSASISGTANHLLNITVRRITPYVPTVIGKIVVEKP